MDLVTVLAVLIVICLVAAGALAWQLRRWGEPILPPRPGARQLIAPAPAAPPPPPPPDLPAPAPAPPPDPPAAPRAALPAADAQAAAPAPGAQAAPPAPAVVRGAAGPAAATPVNGMYAAPPPAAPGSGAHAAAAPRPAPGLDHGDPLVQRYVAVLAEAERARVGAQAVPAQFTDRTSMNAELTAVGRHLEAVDAQLRATGPVSREDVAARLDRLSGRLTSIRRDAEAIGRDIDLLALREPRLEAEALRLNDDLSALGWRAPYSAAVGPHVAAAADLIDRVMRLPARAEIGSLNALKYRLREMEELWDGVASCRAALRAAADQRGVLRALGADAPPAPEPAPPAPEPAPPAPEPAPPAPDDAEAEALEALLLRMAGGDRAVVERLIELERQRSPGAPRAVLLRSAVERWWRDNG